MKIILIILAAVIYIYLFISTYKNIKTLWMRAYPEWTCGDRFLALIISFIQPISFLVIMGLNDKPAKW